jgi:hypothetical protein
MRHRIREAVRESVPADETVLVMSKGDADLVDLYGREAWHFPPPSGRPLCRLLPKAEHLGDRSPGGDAGARCLIPD